MIFLLFCSLKFNFHSKIIYLFIFICILLTILYKLIVFIKFNFKKLLDMGIF